MLDLNGPNVFKSTKSVNKEKGQRRNKSKVYL